MLVRCETKGCENYNVLIERNMDEEGNYKMNYNQTCPECGYDRVEYTKITEPHFSIDHTNLNSKRMFETKVRKYTHD